MYYPTKDNYLQQEYNNASLQQQPPIFKTMEKTVVAFRQFTHNLESTLIATQSGVSALLQLSYQIKTSRHLLSRASNRLLLYIRWITGTSSSTKIFSVKEFERFNRKNKATRYFSKIPSILFTIFTAIVVIRLIITVQQQQQKKNNSTFQRKEVKGNKQVFGSNKKQCIDPKKLKFVRAIFPYQEQNFDELSFKSNDLIAILSKESKDWWRGRLKSGKVGCFPANHVVTIHDK